MNADKLHIDQDFAPMTVDTRHHFEGIKNTFTRKRVGAVGLLLAAGAVGVGAAELHNSTTPEDAKVTQTYTAESGDTVYNLAQELCGVDPADVSKVIFNLDEANPDLASGHNQISAGQKIVIPENMCDISPK